MKFTQAGITAIVPRYVRFELHDQKVSGLTIRVSPSGVKVFYLYRRIAGKPERIKIGRFPQVSLEVARLRAAELNGQIAMGGNPAAIKRAAKGEISFDKLFDDYMAHHVRSKGKHLSPQTARSYRYAFDQYCTDMKNDRASRSQRRCSGRFIGA